MGVYRVVQQIERMIEEGEGERRNVLVQMDADRSPDARLLKAVAEISRRRTATISARDLLPPTRSDLDSVAVGGGTRLSRSAKRVLRSTEASFASQIASLAFSPPPLEVEISSGYGEVDTLLSSGLVQQAIAQVADRRTRTKSYEPVPTGPSRLWASRSLVLNIARDDLAKLPQEMPRIRGVYENRTLRLPGVAEVTNLPEVVASEKASSWGSAASARSPPGGPMVSGAPALRWLCSIPASIRVIPISTGKSPAGPSSMLRDGSSPIRHRTTATSIAGTGRTAPARLPAATRVVHGSGWRPKPRLPPVSSSRAGAERWLRSSTESPYFAPDDLPLPYSKPELSAPGVAIISAAPGGGRRALNGTSMATPHVAGAIALLLSGTAIREKTIGAERASLTLDLIIGSVEELGEAGQDHRYGFGRVDVLRALGFARDGGY